MTARLVREATGVVVSDMMFLFHGWIADHPDQSSIKTVNNVTVFQPRGRLEWVARVEWVFCEEFPNSNLARLATLRRSVRRGEWFVFRDRYGSDYRVRAKGVPVPEREADVTGLEYYHLTLDLLVQGYE